MTWTDREGPIQRACVAYLRQVLPGAVVYHPPNEIPLRGRDVARAIAKAKANGMLPGFPDILIYHEGQGYTIEIKAEGNGLSDAQKRVREQLEQQNIPYAVCRSVEDVRETLAAWGVETTEVRAAE